MLFMKIWLLIVAAISLINPKVCAYEPEFELDESETSSGFSVRILRFGIAGSRGITKGDKVKILLRSFSPSVESHIVGTAQQDFVAGKHPVTPLNQAILNMRVDEIRRIGIPFGNYGKIYYEVHVLSIE